MDDHPEGPRTLWTQVRDGLPLFPETVARGLELEQGRHPRQAESRDAHAAARASNTKDTARRVLTAPVGR